MVSSGVIYGNGGGCGGHHDRSGNARCDSGGSRGIVAMVVALNIIITQQHEIITCFVWVA